MIRFVDGTIDPLLWFLVDWSIRWGVLIIGLAIWLRAQPPRRAATRHLCCATALVVGLFLPLAPRWAAPWAWSRIHVGPAPAAREQPAINEPIPRPVHTVIAFPIAESERPVVAPATTAPVARDDRRINLPVPVAMAAVPRAATGESLGAWRLTCLGLAVAWLVGAGVAVARIAVGWGVLARLRSSSHPVARANLARFRSELESRRLATLAAHPAVGSPVVLGGMAPLILVPDDWDALPEASQRACLLHELAHLERRDDLAKLAAEVATIPFWFHPAVVWLRARLDREAELACDDVAVGRGVSPLELARLLAVFAARPFRLNLRGMAISRQALTFFDRNTVADRITRLLEVDMTRTIIPPPKFKSVGQAAIVAALALLIGGARLRAIEPGPPPEPAQVQAAKAGQAAAPARSFSVVIKDADDRPIEGATVIAGIVDDDHARDVTVARTKGDGSARFDREPEPAIWIAAFKKGHAFSCQRMVDETGAVRKQIVLPRPRSLAGLVAGAEGRPIALAEVRVEAVQESKQRTFHFAPAFAPLVSGTLIERAIAARSDAQGNFRFESLPDDAIVSLKISAEGKATTRTQVPPSSTGAAGEPEAVTRIVLAPEAKVAGQVVSAVPGVSVAGRTVTLQGVFEGTSATIFGKATTDAAGQFVIGGLAAGRVNVFLDDVPAHGPWTFRAASGVRLVPGATAEAKIELVAGVIVTGSVASTDGKPLAGVQIAAYGARNPRTGTPAVTTDTDAAGTYRFRMAPGDLFVTINGGVAGYTTSGNAESSQSVVIPSGGSAIALQRFVMAPGVKLVGRIVDAVGKPLPGARLIGVCNQNYCSPLNQPSATADAKGAFSLDTQADGQPIPLNEAVTFQVRLADGKEFDASLVTTGSGAVTIKLPTLRDGGPKGPAQVAPDELAGVVVDVQGRPIEGVLAHPYSWVPNFKVVTDKAGRFRIKVPGQGKREIRFTKDGYEPREFLGQQTGQTDWVVVMDDKTYFEGRVLDPGGKPVANAPIRADSGPKRLASSLMSACWTEGKSGNDGRYRLYVEPGMYEFQVRVPGAGVARLPKQAIATDEKRSFDIALSGGVDFEARVVDAQDGKPVAGFLLKDWQNPSVAGTSNDEGVIRIPAMMPGPFNFGMIEAEGYSRWWSDACNSEHTRFQKAARFGFQRNFDGLDFDMKPGMPPVTIRAEKAVTIRGRVLDPSGKPVAGATVAPALTGSGNSLTGDTRFSVETDQSGTFTMRLPASGDIAYNLVAHDGKFQEWRSWGNGISPPFQTKPGQVLENVTLSLTRPATVRGRVMNDAGQPVAGREVRASAADKRENRYYDPTTTTRADGTFELRFIRPGEQHIQVAPFWLYADQAPTASSRTIKLVEAETRTGVELTAAPER